MAHSIITLDNIPFQADRSALLHNPRFTGDPNDSQICAAWEAAAAAARPKAIAACVEVIHDQAGKVVSVGGQRMDSVVLDKQLAGLHRAFAYIATCGTEVAAIQPGDHGDGKTALFLLRMQALGAALAAVNQSIQDGWSINKLAALNPGSLPEWPISEQPKLFSLLGDGPAAIGVTLGSHMFMSPMETSSGLLFETEQNYKNCMVCTRLDCVGRQAPFDEAMAKALRG